MYQLGDREWTDGGPEQLVSKRCCRFLIHYTHGVRERATKFLFRRFLLRTGLGGWLEKVHLGLPRCAVEVGAIRAVLGGGRSRSHLMEVAGVERIELLACKLLVVKEGWAPKSECSYHTQR